MGVAEHVPHVQRAADGRRRRVDREDVVPDGRRVEAVGAIGVPLGGPAVFDAVECRLVGNVRHSRSAEATEPHLAPSPIRLRCDFGRPEPPKSQHKRSGAGLVHSVPCCTCMTLRPAPCVNWLFVSRARSASTCAGRPCTAPRTSVTVGRRSATTSCAAISSGPASTCGSSRTSPTSTTTSSTARNREDRPWQDIATKCEAMWFKAMDGIGVQRPDDIPHATEYVDEMVELIGELVALDKAYVTDDGVYMDVESVDDYGLLAFQTLDDMRAGGGDREVFGADQKRHPADFVLWKFSKPDEPAWPSPWGDGRPGLAQRVRRDEPRPARRGLRPALRRPGPAVPAPRERAGPGGRARQDVRQPLDAQRVRRRRRGREDVEVDRQRVEPARPDRALRPARLSTRAAAVALPQPGQARPGRRSIRRSRRSPDSTRSPRARPSVGGRRSRSGGPRRVPSGDGRRPRHAQGDGARVRHGARGERGDRRR